MIKIKFKDLNTLVLMHNKKEYFFKIENNIKYFYMTFDNELYKFNIWRDKKTCKQTGDIIYSNFYWLLFIFDEGRCKGQYCTTCMFKNSNIIFTIKNTPPWIVINNQVWICAPEVDYLKCEKKEMENK